LLCVGFPIAVAFIVGSPGRLGFWVALVGVFMITVPAFAVVSWFRNDVRAHRNAQNVERRTLALLAIFGDRLPAHEVLDMESLVVAGEPGVAFENLCVQLYEYDVPLEPEAPTRLAEVGEPMRIDPSYWQKLVSPPPRPDLRP
jgi:hypothetical protein